MPLFKFTGDLAKLPQALFNGCERHYPKVAGTRQRMISARCAAVLAIVALTTPAPACDQPIVLSNWKSCMIGPLGDGTKADWAAVPTWTKAPAIRPYFFDDPRLLANHGLCNAKYRRVVLCLPGWEERPDKDACWFLICAGFRGAGLG
jgi:hypothetical protein